MRARDASNTRIIRTVRHYAVHPGTPLQWCCMLLTSIDESDGAGDLYDGGAPRSTTGLLKGESPAVRPRVLAETG